jgi:hypothetical protein
MLDAGRGAAVGGGLSDEGRARLERELAPGERVAWAGHPSPGAYARSAWLLMVFGLLFIAFGVAWIVATGASGPQLAGMAVSFSFMWPVGLLPLGVGVLMLLAPVWMSASAGRVVYAVTDRRALVVTPVLFRGVSARSFSPAQLASAERIERADGSGSLVFARDPYSSTSSDGVTTHGHRSVGFLGLADVKSVERCVRELAGRGSTQHA